LRVAEADAPTDLKASPRLVVRVIDLKKLREGPKFSEEGPLENLSQMETKLAWLLLRELAPDNAPSEEAFSTTAPPSGLTPWKTTCAALWLRMTIRR
jgi:hypothetical protein